MFKLWFGPRGYERWVALPAQGVQRGLLGWSSRSEYVGGGVSVSASDGDHMEYSFSWNALSSADTRHIRDILNGAYATDGNRGLIYFIDPAANTLNLFSEMWARPSLCASFGAPSLIKGKRPTLVATGANAFGLPPRSAQFTIADGDPANTFYVPIPPGYAAHFGFYGPTEQADKIIARPYTGETAGAPVAHDIQANADYGTGLSTVSSASGATGVEFYLSPTAGTATITAAVLQVIPVADTPVSPVSWISGQGHSGCQRDGSADQTLITSAFDQQSLGVNLVERGSWL